MSVSALGLDQSWLGRELDDNSITELVALGRKFKFHVGLEGGEGETFVLDAPFFSSGIQVRASTKHWRGDSGYLEITDATLGPKTRTRAVASSQGSELSPHGRRP